MLKILDKDKAPLKGLRVYYDLCIEGVLDLDDRTLSFSAPYRNIRGILTNECYIETKEDRFVVKEIEKSTDGKAKVLAQLDMESLEGKVFRSFKSTEQTIQAALQLAFAGTGWTIGKCEVIKKRTLSMANVSAIDVLKQALKTYRAEIRVDSKLQVIDIYESVGEDKGVYLTTQLNVRELNVQSTSYDFYTEIEPYGKDGLTIEAVNGGKNYLENHQYSKKKKRFIWKDERYTVPQSLKEDAESKLEELSRPYTSYSAEVIDLAAYSKKYSILEYRIGDTVTLMDGITDTREKQRIVGIKRYPDAPEKNTCTLANKVLTFSELAEKYETAANTVDNITNDNGQIDGDAIDGIHSRQIVDLENAIIQSATIIDLTTKYLQVSGKLTAVEGEFGKLSANVAEFEQATIGRLTAIEADIVTLRTTELEAANAKIDILENNYANIKTLLAGNAGIGDLQNIHLTSANAVIDSALIRTAVMQTVTIGDLLAGDISTNKFRILSDDGGIMIQGATQQWRDQNGVVRMQAGRDAKGAFTFALFDTTGKGLLIDHTGIKPGAIADGIIVNDMVSEGAGISASKLDIHSLFTAVNNSAEVIRSDRIWFDEGGQNLTQAYSQTQKNITTIQSTANSASNTASAAADAAKKALDTLSGISTLDAIGATLDNDAHVVHTMPDGSGGDYSGCYAALTVWLGDTDVSDHLDEVTATPSAGVSGTWNAKTRTYRVTGMSTDTGYVDFAATYGLEPRTLTVGGRLLVIGGKALQIKSAGAKIKKRFSISKSRDGKVGLSHNLRSSTLVLRKQKDGRTLVPSSVTFSAYKNDNGAVSSFSGIYQIEESRDAGKTYVIKYGSAAPELQVIYTPSGAEVNMIRCTLYDASGVQSLDTQTVTILADAEGLAEDIQKAQETADKAQEAIVTTNNKVTQIQTGMDGIKANLSEITTDLHGLTDNTLLYNVKYHDNGDETTTLTAIVYKDGRDVTKEYPPYWYSWRRKTESGETFIGYGYTITVKNSDYTFGGTAAGRFTTYKQAVLAVGSKLLVVGGKALIFAVSA